MRDVRAERLLTIRELADRAGVAPSTIFMIEAGRSIPRPSVARALAEALRADPRGIVEFQRTIRRLAGHATRPERPA